MGACGDALLALRAMLAETALLSCTCRRHIQHRVEWQKKDTQLCKQIQLLEIASARSTLLESQIQDLQAEIHRNKTSALEEASHAREQLDQAQAIMNDHISDLSSRVSILAHDLRVSVVTLRHLFTILAILHVTVSHMQNSESTISKLRSADRSLSLQLLKAENCNKQLQQELLDAQSTVETLTMELNDNVQRWEHECTSRMEAEEALKQALADLVEAKSAAKAAAECAHKSDREKAAAVQHLSSLRTRKGNIHSVKVWTANILCLCVLKHVVCNTRNGQFCRRLPNTVLICMLCCRWH